MYHIWDSWIWFHGRRVGFLAFKAWETSYHSLLVLSPFHFFGWKRSEQGGIGHWTALILTEGKKVGTTCAVLWFFHVFKKNCNSFKKYILFSNLWIQRQAVKMQWAWTCSSVSVDVCDGHHQCCKTCVDQCWLAISTGTRVMMSG